jgi:hypothetical protein
MLEVELDIFSGMPNPRWVLTRREEQELVDRLTAEPANVSAVATADEQFGLGYRGLIVRLVKPDEDSPWSKAQTAAGVTVPGEFRVGSAPDSQSLADWLLQTSEPERKRSLVTDELREVASRGVILQTGSDAMIDPTTFAHPAADDAPPEARHFPTIEGEGADSPGTERRSSESPPEAEESSQDVTIQGATWWACGSSYFSANAGVFNLPEHVGRNNCYCFASNHLAGVRYALPGKRGGRPASSITCGGVIDGLYADGWRDGCQVNGLTIVMVIWPNYDYHFYRLITGGPYWWWGHKPGGTPAKYTDDCGHAIYQYNGSGYAPNNCCRGNYIHFCGYFYQNNSTAFVA